MEYNTVALGVPLIVKVALFPEQIVVEPEIEAVGDNVTLMVAALVGVALHPALPEAITRTIV